MKVNAKAIKYLMGTKLMTQEGLSVAANISRSTVNVTLQRGSCSTSTAGKIADALGVEPAEIIETEE